MTESEIPSKSVKTSEAGEFEPYKLEYYGRTQRKKQEQEKKPNNAIKTTYTLRFYNITKIQTKTNQTKKLT